MSFDTGAHLGPYEIIAPLGAGGMGEVYRARDTRLNRIVAIKMLPADKLADEERKRRFIQEARSASALNHPNIVTIHDVLTEGGADFIVMEFVDGETLTRLIPKGGMRPETALRYAIQIAAALAAAHAAGIIHRDLKPGNIMVTADGRVKLLDFGLAKLNAAAAPDQDERTRTLGPASAEGSIVGTVAYMSPEQAEARPVDPRSDIFSFGAVLYEMVTGVRAFHGDSNLSTLSAILRDNPKPVAELATDIPRELDRIITRCLRKDPARRFQGVPDLKVALEDLKEESDSGKAEIAGSLPARRSSKSSRKALVAAGIVIVAAAAAGWTFFRSSSQPPPPHSVPLTTYAGSEIEPSFSPDGTQVAFAWQGEKRDKWDIYVKLVEGGQPLRLTTNPGPARLPAWSPDGRQIAFLRETGVYSVSPLGGPERKIVEGSCSGFSWMPDSQQMLVSLSNGDADPHAIYLLSISGGDKRKLTSPPATNSADGDIVSAVSPDGRKMGFVRASGSTTHLYLQPLPSGSARLLTDGNIQSARISWIDDSEMIFPQGTYGSAALWRMKVDGESPPRRVAGVPDGADDPAIVHPLKGPARLAYEQWEYDANIWRIETVPDGTGRGRTAGAPSPVATSTRVDMSPDFSPDGKRIVFVSDRDGFREIWTSAADGSGPVQLTSFNGARCGSPKWSPDGRYIVFDALAGGNTDIWTIPADGGPPKRITAEPSNEARPSWSRDGRWIYFRSDRSGSQQIWRVPAAEPYQPATQITQNGAFEGLESWDGTLLYFVKPTGPFALWSVPAAGGGEKLVVDGVRSGDWTVSAAGIYYFDVTHASAAGRALLCFDPLTGKAAQVAVVSKPLLRGSPMLTVSREGRFIAWAQVDHVDADLMLIEGFR